MAKNESVRPGGGKAGNAPILGTQIKAFIQSTQSMSYRPHDPGHNYYDRGIYLITLVVSGRQPLLSSLNMDAHNPASICTALGTEVLRCWNHIPEHHQKNNRKIKVHASCCMPDHFHGVIEVCERMDVSVGEVIRGFKIGCTKAWQQSAEQPNVAALNGTAPTGTPQHPAMQHPSAAMLPTAAQPPAAQQPHLVDRYTLQHMSHKQRQQYYATLPRTSRPLFDANYDDTICLATIDPITHAFTYDQRHFAAMLRYVLDNPRRAILRRLRPDFMQRLLHIRIAGRDYAAFGNIFLLRWARKVQVFCHRNARLGQLTEEERTKHGYTYAASPTIQTRIPYDTTTAFHLERTRWIADILAGATVIVTPGISKGEQAMKNECLEKGYPLIHLQKEPITPYWKPELTRFEACTRGSLLILAPWQLDDMDEVNHVPSDTDFSRFHNLNELAREICLFDGDASIVNGRT